MIGSDGTEEELVSSFEAPLEEDHLHKEEMIHATLYPLLDENDSSCTNTTRKLELEDDRSKKKKKSYMYNKLKYYQRLERDWNHQSPDFSPNRALNLVPPAHVLPPQGR